MAERRVSWLTWLLLCMFLPCLIQMWRYQVWESAYLNGHRFNSRRSERLEFRGQILDRNGKLLAESRGAQRVYPLGEAVAPLIGYADLKYGIAGVESWCDSQLRGEPPMHGLADLWNTQSGRKGEDVKLSLDANLQLSGYEALEGHRGALLVLALPSGQVLASVSRPSFDPIHLGRDWAKLSKDPQSPLLDRAGQGLYAGGHFSFPLLPETGSGRKMVPVWAAAKQLGEFSLVSLPEVAHSAASAGQGTLVYPRLLGSAPILKPKVGKARPPAAVEIVRAANPEGGFTTWGVARWPAAKPCYLLVLALEAEDSPAGARSLLVDIVEDL